MRGSAHRSRFGSLFVSLVLAIIALSLPSSIRPLHPALPSGFLANQALAAGTNLIGNGSFESTGSSWLSPWYFIVRSGAAGSISQTDATSADGNYSALVSITQASSTSPWLVQLSQRKLPFTAGQTYTISFAAKADTARKVTFVLQQSVSPYTVYSDQTVDLTTSWQTFSVAYTATVSDSDVSLNVNLAGATGQVWLDRVEVAASSSSAEPSSLSFQPVADAYVDEGNPGANYGNHSELRADTSPNRAAFLRFDVAGLSGSVQRATLRLYVRDGSHNGPAVYTTGNDWTETGITWSNQPAVTGTTLDNAGSIASGTWIEYDVTTLVTGNGSVSVKLVPESADGTYLYARESSYPPELVVMTSGDTSGNDTTAPETTITSGPSGTVSQTSASFAFTSSETGSSFECQLDAGGYSACTSPTEYTDLTDGSHTFEVRAIDAAGNVDATPASQSWTVEASDTLLPVADAHVRADRSSSNYGWETTLWSDGSPATASYLKFDLTSLADQQVASAKLRMYVTNSSGSTQAVRQVADTTWDEATITYDNRPAAGPLIATFPGGSAGSWVEVDVTTGIASQAGRVMTLAIDSSGSDGFDFSSRNSASNQVNLVIEMSGDSGDQQPKGVSLRPFAEYWGGNVEGMKSDFWDMNAANITWARLDLYYSSTPNPAFDTAVQLASEYGIQLLVIVHKPWPNKDLGSDADRAVYRAWLAEMVARYRYHVKHWEIMNEPNLHYEWNIDESDGSDQTEYEASVRRYVTHLQDGYETVKANDPSATVLFGGLSEWKVERYMDVLITTDAWKYFDIMAYHPYGWDPDRVLSRYNSFKGKMALNASYASKPIWVTEIDFNTSWSNKAGYVTSEQQKAEYLRQAMQKLHEAGARLPIFWYTLHENDNDTGYGLTVKDPATLQTQYLPAYYAYRDLTY